MTRLLVSIYILFNMNSCNDTETKTAKNLTEVNTIQPDIKNYDLNILLGCGAAGKTSEQIEIVNGLLKSKDYKTLATNLGSEDLLTQLLSAIALDELNKRKLFTISEQEKKIISKIKSSNKTFHACVGCTEQYSGKITDIFENKDSTNILKLLKFEIGFGDN